MDHPPPSARTIKELYGCAVECAYPDCHEPLYKGPNRTRNSEVAHICPRRHGEPRWREMPSTENQHFNNLLLLCALHHTEVDRPEMVTDYGEAKLLGWKQEQVRLADQGGIEISDREAEAIYESLVAGDSFQIVAETINLGGFGGGSLGAAGGGGGVLGSGMGGTGGIGHIGDIHLDGQDGPHPGAGGGGGGTLDSADLPNPGECTEGSGAVYGFDGQPGDVSAFSTGATRIEAPGGKVGLTGSGIRLTSSAIGVSSVLIGEHFHVRDGLVFATAGGWSWLSCLNLPETRDVPVLVVLEAGNVPPGDYTIHVDMLDPHDAPGGRTSFPLTVETAGELVRIPVPLTVSATFNSYGRWTLVISSEIAELARLPISVRRF